MIDLLNDLLDEDYEDDNEIRKNLKKLYLKSV